MQNAQRNLFEYEEEDYYKPVRVGNFWSNNCIEYKCKGDIKTLSVKTWNYDTNRNNMLENPLLHVRPSLQVAYY